MSSSASALPDGFMVSERLANEDLLPVKERNWGSYSFFALWMSDIHSLGGYVFAAGLFFLGLSGWQILLSMLAGILIVNQLLNGVGVMGQKTGVPYPVLARLSFGVFGANIPALIRAAVGIVWYGVQTWLASLSLVILVEAIWPGASQAVSGQWLGLSALGWICFMAMWLLQLLLFWRGMEWVRRFIDFCGPAVYLVMFALAAWMLSQAGWDAFTLRLSDRVLTTAETVYEMLGVVALVVAYFAALLLNFADFSRFGVSEQAVRRGNFWGLPINFMLFALVTVIVTASTLVVFGEAILDPIEVVHRIENKPVLIIGSLTFVIATIGINIVANFVSAAYDIANVAPRHITFARGGLITALLSIAVLPWQLYHNPVVIKLFVGSLGACLGPLFGIIIVDYYWTRRRQVVVADLYSEAPDGCYWYQGGVNLRAVWAFVPAAVMACLLVLSPWFKPLEAYGWLVGTLLAGGIYGVIMPRLPATRE
ncbi:NCS1 family nucleobase:cation symporter-1 [Craterilacuibacter sinensis]|uniref:NCS1 family nucleobase:cation symporter-1 n=1 Tax=Craterilacuibacter sinensis TaxID=2686017 RepID=A0A845BMS4_9NEIS|nr:NCS1 family nucleobase:cation symporter-1 [Craterilacuibacter sinensis]MXR36498.1 NCS1 family nucleobase:cation symporter-1 [Craterilacuibacter sinensis]